MKPIRCGRCGDHRFVVDTSERLGGKASITCQQCCAMIWSAAATPMHLAALFAKIAALAALDAGEGV
jgi:hypothetical protein